MYKTKYTIAILLLSLVLLVSFTAALSAEPQIRITRPLDGSTVREVVNILVPVEYVPAGGFVAYTIDDRFKAASADLTEDNESFVFRWNTKAIDSDTSRPLEKRKPRDGKHTITVQAYDASNKIIGPQKTITVNVKNDASSNMPKNGIRLKYNYKSGTASKYKFRYTVNVKSIQGAANALAGPDTAAEGGELIVKRDVEEVISSNEVLIRSRFVGIPQKAFNGKLVPQYSMTASSRYQYEDGIGQVNDVVSSLLPGSYISVYLPKLTRKNIKIGDSWYYRAAVLRDPYSGQETVLNIKSTLIGLEWEGGYPCAKIKSTFSGMGRVPYSSMVTRFSPISGEIITYFAFTTGKLISSSTKATVQADVNPEKMTELGIPGATNRSGGLVSAELLVEQKMSLAR